MMREKLDLAGEAFSAMLWCLASVLVVLLIFWVLPTICVGQF